MARRNREKVLYNNDGTVLIQSDSDTSTTLIKTPNKAPAKLPGTVKVVDILDALAGWSIPQFNLLKSSSGKGECVICGKQTAYKNRTLCIECMENYAEDLYAKAKEAVENGETTVNL